MILSIMTNSLISIMISLVQVAQLVEHLAVTWEVVSSTPAGPSNAWLPPIFFLDFNRTC